MSQLWDRLRALHAIDRSLIGLKRRLLAAREEQALHGKALAAAADRRRRAEEAIRRHTLDLDRLQLDDRAAQAELADQERRIRMIKNNAEYDIVVSRTRELRRQIDGNETGLLQGMEALDALRAELAQAQAALAACQADGQALAGRSADDGAAIRQEQMALKGRRDRAVADLRQLDAHAYGIYDDALRSTRGDALGELRGKVCQSCGMRLSPAVVDAALVGRDLTAARCGGCGRILMAREEPVG